MRLYTIYLLVLGLLAVAGCSDDAATACAEGALCDDHNPCTEDDLCGADGVCRGTAKDCSDGYDCSLDGCSQSTGECISDVSACECAGAEDCDDGDPCTDDTCLTPGGTCESTPSQDAGCRCTTPAECDDGDPCTVDDCDAATLSCTHEIDPQAACDDGDPCTDSDACLEDGTCVGVARICDDGNPCTDDTCDATGDCVFTVEVQNVCTDYLVCTDGDHCQPDGRCEGTPIACDDARACTMDSCDPTSGQCVFDTIDCQCATALDCDDFNSCTVDTCDATAERCVHEVLVGATCDDGDLCTHSDACQTNATCDGTPMDCDDGNGCTDDSCDLATGQCDQTAVVSRLCDDGNACTHSDLCQADATCDGTPITCDDSRACTIDTCNAQLGTCLFDTTNCVCSVDADCDDSNSCTDDTCNTSAGTCNSVAVPGRGCIDGNNCTVGDMCQSDGTCLGIPMSCTDPDQCTDSSCDPATGQCTLSVKTGSSCTDHDFCTTSDKCNASGDCVGHASSDVYEENDSSVTAHYLGTVNDNEAYPHRTFQAYLYGVGDVDWYRFHDNDTPWGAFHPRVDLSSVPSGHDYNLCAYFVCDSGDEDISCVHGSFATHGTLKGCCSTSLGNWGEIVELDVNCTGTTDESGDVYVQVYQASGAWVCIPYTLSWGDN